jgi:hypothetical protein
MGTKEDLQNENIPKFIYDKDNYKLREYQGEFILNWGWHHTVKQQQLKRHPELYEHLKLIYFPPINEVYKTKNKLEGNPHLECDNYHSKFKERWGIELTEVIYIK